MFTVLGMRSIAVLLALIIPIELVHAKSLGRVTAVTVKQDAVELSTKNGGSVKLQVISSSTVRVWASSDGPLKDADNKNAPIVINGVQSTPKFHWRENDMYGELSTDHLIIRVKKDDFQLALHGSDNKPLWTELKPLQFDKASTTQILSSNEEEHFFGGGQQNGHFEFKGKTLEVSYSGGWEEGDRPSPAPFYMSSAGYGVLRNTWSNGSYDFRSSDYISAQHQENRFDAYYFVGDLKTVLASYTALTGRAPLLPRWAFEYGDADCYNDGDNVKKPGTFPSEWSDGKTGTTPDVVHSVAAQYREHDMPGGWILPNDGYGCGYTDLKNVVSDLQKHGFKTGLWTENGVDKIAWEVGTAGTRAQKLDVAWTGQGYQFALDANKAAADGILNNSDARPFLWTVMGWAGIQRYAVTWTGDQSGSWDYIRWHIPTLIGSGLSGQVYATGDVDGIFGGSPETYTRDLQWKSFTPVLMGMSGWAAAERKHPWWFDEPYRSINRRYLKLKMRLTPYMYTYAADAEKTGEPIVRGLMWDFPTDKNALTEKYKNQFFLGKDFLIAPVYKSQSASKGWREDIYLPQGQWIDYWDGTVSEADANGRTLAMPVSLDKTPVLVRAGAIIPMYPSALYDEQVPKDKVTFDIYPFGQSEFVLYEDDGVTRQYKNGKQATQVIRVQAPRNQSGLITLQLDAVVGEYQNQLNQRAYEFSVHTRYKPLQVQIDQKIISEVADQAAFEKAKSAWFYSDEKYGTVWVKIASGSIREAHTVELRANEGIAIAQTKPYAAMPARSEFISADEIIVLNRPPEEAGQGIERMFDQEPNTWFRTKRDLSIKTGPHEFTLAFAERRFIRGVEWAPRNDQHWQYGQVRDVEIYIADSNGAWGAPTYSGQLKHQQAIQRIEFAPKAGRLIRFRILSTHAVSDGDEEADPMVLAASNLKSELKPVNNLVPSVAGSVAISEMHILEVMPPTTTKQQQFLSNVKAQSISKHVQRDKPTSGSSAMKMNGLQFHKGLGVAGKSMIDYRLQGYWHTFRSDIGIDDSCVKQGGMNFHIYGDDKLLYSSGIINAPAVVKPELDIRGIQKLSLRTDASSEKSCGNWANAQVIGYQGDSVGQ